MGPEIIDITNLDSPVITLNTGNKPSVNFGGGLELLMNDKHRSGGSSSGGGGGVTEIDLGDLTSLENELNGLTSDIDMSSSSANKNKTFSFESSDQSTAATPFKLNNGGDDNASIGSIVSIGDFGGLGIATAAANASGSNSD